MPGPSARPRLRRLALQVQRPRLRPAWRIAILALAAAAATALLYLGEHAAIDALFSDELAAPTARRISADEERTLDALLARFDAERKEDEERARRIAAAHIDPQACELDFHVDVPFCDESMYEALREERVARAEAGERIRLALESHLSVRSSDDRLALVSSP